jgi:hypothetical protein
MIAERENRKTMRLTSPCSALFTTNPTRIPETEICHRAVTGLRISIQCYINPLYTLLSYYCNVQFDTIALSCAKVVLSRVKEGDAN